MLEFNQIFAWAGRKLTTSREVKFEQRGWYYYIMKNDGYFAHGCPEAHGGDRVRVHREIVMVEFRCGHCDEMAPSQFQAVVTLHEAGRSNVD